MMTPKFPDVPPPELLKNATQARQAAINKGSDRKLLRSFRTERVAPSCEIRPCDENLFVVGSEGKILKQYIWMRYSDPIG